MEAYCFALKQIATSQQDQCLGIKDGLTAIDFHVIYLGISPLIVGLVCRIEPQDELSSNTWVESENNLDEE